VAYGIKPVAFATGLKRHGAFNSTDSPGASWRILIALLILRLIRRVILGKSTWGVLGEQQNRRRKYCKGKSCAFSHGVPHCGCPDHGNNHLEFRSNAVL